MKRMLVIATAGLFLLFGARVFAQDRAGEDVTEYFMDAAGVEGDVLFPSEGLVTGRRPGKTKSLIKVRRHFVSEMIKTVEDI